MLTASQLRPGTPVVIDGRAYMVESTARAGTAQRRATYHVKLRDIETNQNLERSFSEHEKFEEPEVAHREVQYTYRKGRDLFFLDQTDYGEYGLPEDRLGNARYFLKEGENYRMLLVDGRPVGLELPSAYTLEVVETAPPTKTSMESNVLKEARLETGLTVRVPQFLKVGDKVKVATDTLEYLGKA